MENNKNDFKETQKFSQWWIYVILALVSLPFIAFFAYQEVTGKLIGNHPVDNHQYLFIILFVCLVNSLFFVMQLQTRIDLQGIHVRFFPFKPSFKHYKWDDIETVSIRHYDPISEFGGWGVRYSFKDGKALTTSGNFGIQIKTKKGKKILIGTRKPEQAEIAIKQLAPGIIK